MKMSKEKMLVLFKYRILKDHMIYLFIYFFDLFIY